ncbi:MAG: FG-GAP repeat protein, partial [Candidatus Krumholzibacteriota bacterium]|nr:FG-GAP repeat protein [Candidatus Krumholzibacteriota bacterium]
MLGALLLITAGTASAGTGEVQSHRKISDTAGGFGGGLTDFAQFGTSVGTVGDVDGDGVDDLAVGARQDDDGGLQRGAVWILFMTDSATVKSHQKISATHGGFTGALNDFDLFGSSLAALGDLDNDGVSELAVGARLDDDGGNDRGAVWILFLNS